MKKMTNSATYETESYYDYKSLVKKSIYTSFKVTTGIGFVVATSTYAFGAPVLLSLNTLGRLGTSIAARNIEKKIMEHLH